MKLSIWPAGGLGVYYHSDPGVSRLEEWWVRAVDAPVGAGQEVPTMIKYRAMKFRPFMWDVVPHVIYLLGRWCLTQGVDVPPIHVRWSSSRYLSARALMFDPGGWCSAQLCEMWFLTLALIYEIYHQRCCSFGVMVRTVDYALSHQAAMQ